METAFQVHVSRYTATCMHCARVVFRNARHVSEVQVTMIESHLLICRPLATIERPTDLFAHCRIAETAT